MRLTQRVRRTVWPALDDEAEETFGGAGTSYSLSRTEHVADFECPPEELEALLVEDYGFRFEPIAALKIDWDGNTEWGSYALRKSPFADLQLHAHIFDIDGGSRLCAHEELNWRRHPVRHYLPRGTSFTEPGYYSPENGVKEVESLLEGSDYEGELL